MKDLSRDIEIAIQNALAGIAAPIDILKVDDNKLERLMKSRLESFVSIKEMVVLWQNSPNAPSHEKLRKYIEKTVKAGKNSIDILREALRKEIDFDDLDAELYGAAIKSKPTIFKAINELNSGVRELELQLESDKFDLSQKEFKRGFPERFANQEFYPERDYHKTWYSEEHDAIIISPDGSLGEMITLDGLNIILPKPPKNKKDILFWNLPKEEQYWRRQPLPQGLTPENEDMYTEYILTEYKRRREGCWFYNNGVPTWVTPAHYMGLQWNEMLETGSFKEFRMAQAKLYYFALATHVDPRSVGMLFVKGRRSGFTEMALDQFVNLSTSIKNKKFGITSKTEADAIVAFNKYGYAIRNLPFFFIPVVKGKIDDVKKMEFGKPSNNTKEAKKAKDTGTQDYLNVLVDYRATATLAYDSIAMRLYLGDEAGKWERPNNYIDHWSNIKPTMVQGGRVVGKALIGSTLNPLDRGGSEYQALYYGSDVKKRNANGRTATGLYSYFLPAHQNYEDYTDRYGVCHETVKEGDYFINAQGIKMTQGALQFLENEFRSARSIGGKALNNARRLDPITIEDAFRDEIQSQLFDIEKINQQLAYNRNVGIENTLVRGNFSWKDGQKFTTVTWNPCDNGRFLLAWIPPKEMQNQWKMKNVFGINTKCPIHDDVGFFGCDPYDQDGVVDSKLIATDNGVEFNKGSRGALHGLTGFNFSNAPSNFFFLEYICRPKDSDTFFEDVLMACVFYSMPILIENNKKMLLDYFYRNGYRGYSMTRFDREINRLSPDEKKYGGIPNQSQDIINRHWTGIEAYIRKYVGEYEAEDNEKPIREEGEMGSMPFNKTLTDWLKFDVKKRTDYDATISSGLAIMAANSFLYKPKDEKKAFSLKIRQFKLSD